MSQRSHEVRRMMSFNIDFITGHPAKKRPPSSRTFEAHARALVDTLSRIEKNKGRIVKQAWIRLTAARKVRVNQFQIVQRMIDHRLRTAFYQLLHFIFVSKKGKLDSEKKYDYPIAVIARVIGQLNNKNKKQALRLLKKNKRQSQNRQNHLKNMFDIFQQFAKRNVANKFFRGVKVCSVKASEYMDHLRGFEYLFETIRVKALFQAFTCLSIKTITKNVGDLQKEKAHKREQARLSFMKRSEVLNELKRKVTNVIGQVNEGQINNNRKKVTGSRENGMKLTKINEDSRLLEIHIQDLEWKVAKLEEEANRKEQYIANRSNNEASLDFLKEIYNYISSVDVNQVTPDQVFKKITKGVDLNAMYQALNFQIMDNIVLKQQMNMYQKIGQPRKTDSYVNCQNENYSLKTLISSLMKTQYLTETVSEMVVLAEELQQSVKQFRRERSVLVQRAK